MSKPRAPRKQAAPTVEAPAPTMDPADVSLPVLPPEAADLPAATPAAADATPPIDTDPTNDPRDAEPTGLAAPVSGDADGEPKSEPPSAELETTNDDDTSTANAASIAPAPSSDAADVTATFVTPGPLVLRPVGRLNPEPPPSFALVTLVHESTGEELQVAPGTWHRSRALLEAQGYRHPLEKGTVFTPLEPHQHAPRG